MKPITSEERFRQLQDSVSLLIAPTSAQKAWTEQSGLPIQELILQLDQVWPLWKERLLETRVIDGQDVAALDSLTDYATSLVDPRHEALFDWNSVEVAPEWTRVRKLAADTLKLLQRPLNAKN